MKTKKIIAQILLSMGIVSIAGLASATGPNLVYIEQTGSTNTITIEQIGSSNWVGGVTVNPATAVTGARDSTDANNIIYGGTTTMTPSSPSVTNYALTNGSDNNITITQTGDSNSSQYSITGSRNSYQSLVIGNNNQTKLTVNATPAVNAGTNVSVTDTVNGNYNLIIQDITATQFTSVTDIDGDYNQVTASTTTTGALSSIHNTVEGDRNVFNINQSGSGVHTLVLNTLGDYNAVTTQQDGTTNSTINIDTTGSFNTITVRSSNTTITSPMTAIAR